MGSGFASGRLLCLPNFIGRGPSRAWWLPVARLLGRPVDEVGRGPVAPPVAATMARDKRRPQEPGLPDNRSRGAQPSGHSEEARGGGPGRRECTTGQTSAASTLEGWQVFCPHAGAGPVPLLARPCYPDSHATPPPHASASTGAVKPIRPSSTSARPGTAPTYLRYPGQASGGVNWAWCGR